MTKHCQRILTVLAVIVFTSYVRAVTKVPLECGPAAALRVCTARCSSHAECQPPMLCCPTKCGGTACLPGVTARNIMGRYVIPRQKPFPANKPGQCPKPTASGPWVCNHRCRNDSDCARRTKCCPGRCNNALACVPPV